VKPEVGFALRRGLSLKGEPALLRGAPAGNVHLARDANVYAGIGDVADDNPVVRVAIATIDAAYAPKTGDVLVHPDGTYRLDRLFSNNGYTAAYIVVPV
jgi:hypothetical protein